MDDVPNGCGNQLPELLPEEPRINNPTSPPTFEELPETADVGLSGGAKPVKSYSPVNGDILRMNWRRMVLKNLSPLLDVVLVFDKTAGYRPMEFAHWQYNHFKYPPKVNMAREPNMYSKLYVNVGL
ncbi:hypothetical protein M413DRAFT_25632 [Hebeloma cylindrosporum]|uniref:Uncharacterized protein n=1 Tax=Hebeloma cylindrosporum TaxID=76867 RepID=A0A0C3CK93_HEBCY|nr:hypothetical protein M413DRAFT_25632 [Hebeloma cylindrosporum h7]